MKNKIIVMEFLFLMGLFSPLAFAATEDDKFAKLVDEYLEFSWRLSPLGATFQGMHKYDGEIEDFSLAAAENRLKKTQEFVSRFQKELNREALNRSNQIDYDLIFQSLKSQEFFITRSRDLERDPGIYPQIVAGVGFLMFTREYAPLPERLDSLSRRMEKMPQILEDGKKNLKNPPKLWTEIAVETTRGSLSLYQQMIGPAAEKLPQGSETRKRLEAANPKVIAALQSYLDFLEKDLIKRSTGSFADGRENFVYRLKNFYLMDQTPEEIKAVATKVLKETETEMERVAAKVDPKKKWWEVLEDAKKNHWPADQLLSEYRKTTDRARQWTRDKKLASIPAEKLDVLPTPVFRRFVIPYAEYTPPAAFEKEQKGFYFVTPVDPTLPANEKESRLGEFYIDIENTTVHEAYPGHHLQFIHQNHLSKIRRISDSAVMSEGWGLYCERLAEEFGFYSTPIDSLEAYRWLMVRAVRVLVDVGLHVDGMTFDQAVKLMIDNTKLERGNAEGEVRRYTQSPTQPLSYLMGMLMIQDLRKEYEQAKGDQFRIGEFHDAILGYGSIPMKLIRESMLAKK